MRAGNWPPILKLGHNIKICSSRVFLIFGLVFVSRDFEVGTVRPLRRLDRQSRTGLIFYYYRNGVYYICHATSSIDASGRQMSLQITCANVERRRCLSPILSAFTVISAFLLYSAWEAESHWIICLGRVVEMVRWRSTVCQVQMSLLELQSADNNITITIVVMEHQLQ